MNIQLLTESQREALPEVILRRNKFKTLISSAVSKRHETFSNGVLISGKPGSGKTTIVQEFLEQMKSDGKIDEFKVVSGHMTKVSLFGFLRPDEVLGNNRKPDTVHVLDDVGCLYDQGCVDILKAALDTRSKSTHNRNVYYNSGNVHLSYHYDDFCIIISNDPFDHPGPHLQAVLDRVHLFKIDMDYDDFVIYNTYIVEKYLNDNEDGLDESVIKLVETFFNEEIRVWFSKNAFRETGINFSIRLIRKFIDLVILFGDEWKSFSIDYEKLSKFCKVEEDE